VPDCYVKDFRPIFEKNEFNKLLMRTKWNHAIELKKDSTPFMSKIYPLSKDKQQKLDGFIEEHLCLGRIHPSKYNCWVTISQILFHIYEQQFYDFYFIIAR